MKDFKINILGCVWDVKYVEHNNPVLDGNRGFCVYRKDSIYIDKTLSKQQLEHTLYHELTHALLAESGFNIDCKDALGNYYEHFVDSLSKCIRSCMKLKK